MSDMTIVDAVDELLPYDGPHTCDTVTDAARALAGITRYLNNATGPRNGKRTLTWGATVYRVLGALDSTLNGFDQLLRQLATATRNLGENPAVYDDRRDRPASTTTTELEAVIAETRQRLSGVLRPLADAHGLASHLGNDG